MLLGIAATCRANGVNFEAYLDWAFERLGTHHDHYTLATSELTPAAFNANSPADRRRYRRARFGAPCTPAYGTRTARTVLTT